MVFGRAGQFAGAAAGRTTFHVFFLHFSLTFALWFSPHTAHTWAKAQCALPRPGAASDSASDSDSDSPAPRPAPAPVFGPVLPPPKRRNSPEWRLFRALVRADVRGVIDVHVRNFLLLAWRERETRLNGRFTIEYVPSAAAAASARSPPLAPPARLSPPVSPRDDASPPSPPADSDAESEAASSLGVPSRALRRGALGSGVESPPAAAATAARAAAAVAGRLERTLSVFSASFPVWGGASVQAADGRDEGRGGRSRLIFTPHVRVDGLAAVGRAAERARRRAGIRAV